MYPCAVCLCCLSVCAGQLCGDSCFVSGQASKCEPLTVLYIDPWTIAPAQASYVGDSCCAAVGNGDLVLISAGPSYYSASVNTVAVQARQAGLHLCPLLHSSLLCPLVHSRLCAVFFAMFSAVLYSVCFNSMQLLSKSVSRRPMSSCDTGALSWLECVFSHCPCSKSIPPICCCVYRNSAARICQCSRFFPDSSKPFPSICSCV